jgi:hypothetical protein
MPIFFNVDKSFQQLTIDPDMQIRPGKNSYGTNPSADSLPGIHQGG